MRQAIGWSQPSLMPHDNRSRRHSFLLPSTTNSITDAVQSWTMEDIHEPTPNQSSIDAEASAISLCSSESRPDAAYQSSERGSHRSSECFTTTRTLPNTLRPNNYFSTNIQSSRARRSSVFTWPFEITCCFFSILCLWAIVQTLLFCNRKPSPAFPFGVTINSIVALLSSLCSLACTFVVSEGVSQMKWNHFARDKARPLSHLQAFDDASRGIWGSAKLLFVPGSRR